MKKALILLSILVISLTSFAQSDTGINLCGIKETTPQVTTLTIDQLTECGELTANNEHLTVVSFSISMAAGEDFKEFKITGNKLTEKTLVAIKKYNPPKFYIENIKLSSKKGTIQNAGFHKIYIKI